jgi:hypothetical protein
MTSNLQNITLTLYNNRNSIDSLTVRQIVDQYNFNISYEYARDIVSFVRNIKRDGFYGLPESTQRLVENIYDNLEHSEQNKILAAKYGTTPKAVRFAKLFIELETQGVFDHD